jgi:hypothetical protein
MAMHHVKSAFPQEALQRLREPAAPASFPFPQQSPELERLELMPFLAAEEEARQQWPDIDPVNLDSVHQALARGCGYDFDLMSTADELCPKIAHL